MFVRGEKNDTQHQNKDDSQTMTASRCITSMPHVKYMQSAKKNWSFASETAEFVSFRSIRAGLDLIKYIRV
jgi:hypothetical protein